MKNFIVVATLCGLGTLVNGASIMSTDLSQLIGNRNESSELEFENECLAKIQEDIDITLNISILKWTFLEVFIAMTKKMQTDYSLDKLDAVINETCYPAVDVENLYSLTMNIAKTCVGEEGNDLTDEEKETIKNNIQRLFCSVFIKIFGIFAFSPDDVCSHDAAGWNKFEKCSKISTFIPKSFREFFFGTEESCGPRSQVLECATEVLKGLCDENISSQIDSILQEALTLTGCKSQPKLSNFL